MAVRLTVSVALIVFALFPAHAAVLTGVVVEDQVGGPGIDNVPIRVDEAAAGNSTVSKALEEEHRADAASITRLQQERDQAKAMAGKAAEALARHPPGQGPWRRRLATHTHTMNTREMVKIVAMNLREGIKAMVLGNLPLASRLYGLVQYLDLHLAFGPDPKATLLRAFGISCVLDVGANSGQFGRRPRLAGYNGRIVSFEPVSGPYQRLAEVAKRDNQWRTVQLALGDREGSATIHVSSTSHFSSLLAQTRFCVENHPGATPVAQEVVSVKRLDEVFRDYVRSPGHTHPGGRAPPPTTLKGVLPTVVSPGAVWLPPGPVRERENKARLRALSPHERPRKVTSARKRLQAAWNCDPTSCLRPPKISRSPWMGGMASRIEIKTVQS